MLNEHQKLIHWILRIAVGTLASVMLAVVAVLLIGIFLPNEQIDNKEILALLGPAFNTVIGAFVGLLGGLSLNVFEDKGNTSSTANTPDPAPETLSE